ncbi:unnamed protein product [Arabidopsis lyrata]|nr:unnamed protein product [Arabidopsis lyrata]
MGDQPVTKADMEGFTASLKDSTTNLANLVAALTNQIAALTNQIANAGQGGGEGMGRNQNQQGRHNRQQGREGEQVVFNENQQRGREREPARLNENQQRNQGRGIPRVENNRVVIDENTSSNEESMKEEIGQENLHNNYDSHMDAKEELVKDEIVDQGNKQSNHVKTDILLFYGISEVDEMLITPEEKLVVQRNLKTLIAHEHEKHYKEENPRRKKSSVLVMIHYKKRLDANFKKTNGLLSVVKKKTTIPEDLPEILTNLRELDSDGYLHDFPPMRDKANEIL